MALVGSDVTMVVGLAKVTGAVNYAPDLQFPRMLYAKALRSPYAHAKVLRIDAATAVELASLVPRKFFFLTEAFFFLTLHKAVA